MRSFAISAILLSVFTVAAEAQTRYREPLRGTVRQRSYLDAGPVAPVGRYQNYVYSGQYYSAPALHFNDRYRPNVLPPAIGGGVSPFCCY
jgi:hypothetical protein